VTRRILVVEDNPLNSELLRDWLEVEGYEAVIAPDLNTAFDALKSQELDMVLLDVRLGAEDGLTLAAWMREQPALREIPVIAVTAQAMASERQHVLENGCRSIVSKPVDFDVLREQLELWLARDGSAQGNRMVSKE